MKKYFDFMLHGGDYNPDQWIDTPEIWDEDMRLMKLANCNTMSVGIFSWTALEPEDGKYDFGWLDAIMDKLTKNGAYAVLATPSGAKPAWMSQKYPEILRVGSNRVRDLHGGRHNHCFTSPLYREKVTEINTRLAERYKGHQALLVWHISNEYGGDCHCPLCQEEFRKWLQAKYKTLDALNEAYWARFWSHKYTDWSQLESPAPQGETSVHGLQLDWKRFTTDRTIDFLETEAAPLKKITPDIPVTINLMGTYPGLNYQKLAEHIDIVSWDNYPRWHGAEDTYETAADVAFLHDLNRSLKSGLPFLLMESTPSIVNWAPVNKLKRPGMHLLSSIQAVAHGSDSVQYFQWRKSRGSAEKFHGAVVDHAGHENTRVFRDVAEVGEFLESLKPVTGALTDAEVAIVYDWENRWAIDGFYGYGKNRDYEGECKRHYRYFWKNGISADIIGMDDDFAKYKLVIAPMLYMVRPGVGERVEAFVNAGGAFVTTFLSGITDENDLCFLGGFPGPLRKTLGIWSEELDSLYDYDANHIVTNDGREYAVKTFCDLIHLETAEALGTYKSDFYAGRPALTRNKLGKGRAYYIAARTDTDFLNDFYQTISSEIQLKRNIETELPEGVTVQCRTDGKYEYLFIMNFTEKIYNMELDGREYTDMQTGEAIVKDLPLDTYRVRVLRRDRA
jgi:beta-galactosidase